MRYIKRRFLTTERLFPWLIASIVYFFGSSAISQASPAVSQNEFGLGIAIYLPINETAVPDGSIITSDDQGFTMARSPYDPKMVGVVNLNPAISITTQEQSQKFPVISNGSAQVRVSGENGAIRKGDLITSSATPGVGTKAIQPGFVLGNAVDNFTPSQPSDVKTIMVTINVHYYSAKPSLTSNLYDIFNLSAAAAYEQPLVVMKYLVAGVIMILSIVFGFLYFGRVASSGIEALGRNPLASRSIQLGILFNVAITIGIVGAGVIVSVLIIRLNVTELAQNLK